MDGKGTSGPEADHRVEVVIEGVSRRDGKNLVNEHVRLELSEKEKREGAGIAAAHASRSDGPPKVAGDCGENLPRRRSAGARVEGHDQRRGLARGEVHLHGDRRAKHRADEGHELFRETAQDESRIGRCVDAIQLIDERQGRGLGGAHGRVKEFLLGGIVPENRRGGDSERAGDSGERRCREASFGERVPGGVEDLVAADPGRASHR